MYNAIQKHNIQYLPQNVYCIKKPTKINTFLGFFLLVAIVALILTLI